MKTRICLWAALLSPLPLWAGEGHHEAATRIPAATAQKLAIEVAQAGPAAIDETLGVSGRVVLNQNATAQVRARFPGVIRSVAKQPGEQVAQGETLATVESNDSLQVYNVTAPVAGTIISRNANIGELSGDEPLFVVSDLRQLWAELFVFSRDAERIHQGQAVQILCLDDPISTGSDISVVLPTAEASSQTQVARAVIANASGHWRAGMSIRADIVLARKEVPLAVKTDALQRMEDKTVVFVQEGEEYTARPVTTGAASRDWTEITGGLRPGERYVSRNSFIIKADIGKSGAAHGH